uniref:Uncharacterized protein n=1 Tax=Anguilla anguilla TaxID=7936 RepID=A0A0E9W7T7_ANGAN
MFIIFCPDFYIIYTAPNKKKKQYSVNLLHTEQIKYKMTK